MPYVAYTRSNPDSLSTLLSVSVEGSLGMFQNKTLGLTPRKDRLKGARSNQLTGWKDLDKDDNQ